MIQVANLAHSICIDDKCWCQSWADSQFFCDHTHFKLANVRWVGWTSNQYYVTSLLMIRSVWERLNPLFKPNQVFTQLSHKILLPKNELWAHIVRLYWGYLAGSGTRVGLQVRLHGRGDLAEYDQNVFQRILHCLHNNKVCVPALTFSCLPFYKKRYVSLKSNAIKIS